MSLPTMKKLFEGDVVSIGQAKKGYSSQPDIKWIKDGPLKPNPKNPPVFLENVKSQVGREFSLFKVAYGGDHQPPAPNYNMIVAMEIKGLKSPKSNGWLDAHAKEIISDTDEKTAVTRLRNMLLTGDPRKSSITDDELRARGSALAKQAKSSMRKRSDPMYDND